MVTFGIVSDQYAEAHEGCPACGATMFKIVARCRCPAFDAKLECVGCGNKEEYTFNPAWRERRGNLMRRGSNSHE